MAKSLNATGQREREGERVQPESTVFSEVWPQRPRLQRAAAPSRVTVRVFLESPANLNIHNIVINYND